MVRQGGFGFIVWVYYSKAKRMIEETDWNSVLSGPDVNLAAANLTATFLSIIDECIPHCLLQK